MSDSESLYFEKKKRGKIDYNMKQIETSEDVHHLHIKINSHNKKVSQQLMCPPTPTDSSLNPSFFFSSNSLYLVCTLDALTWHAFPIPHNHH